MRYKYVLWDFNGTIVNDVDICLNIINELLKEEGKTAITLEKYRSIFTFPVIEYYKRVGIISCDEEFEEYAHKWMNRYYELEKDSKLFEDIIPTLTKIKEMGIQQGVLSASRIDQLTRMLKQLDVDTYMHDILGISDIYAASKVHIGKEFIENTHLNPSDFVMLGDTLHDYEVASQMGIDCILIAQGHQSFEVLKSSGAIVVERAQDVLSLL